MLYAKNFPKVLRQILGYPEMDFKPGNAESQLQGTASDKCMIIILIFIHAILASSTVDLLFWYYYPQSNLFEVFDCTVSCFFTRSFLAIG